MLNVLNAVFYILRPNRMSTITTWLVWIIVGMWNTSS